MDGEFLLPYTPEDRGCDFDEARKLFVRNIQIVGDQYESPWQRFIILPCVEDQKYTFGNVFKSREEQGEFIFLPYSNTARSETSIFEVRVEQSKFWVTPTGRVGVEINHVRIWKRTELRFEDNLGLDGRETFLFRERELHPGAFSYSGTLNQKLTEEEVTERVSKVVGGTVEFTPGQNGLILSQILSYLPVEDVKSSRFVARLWNEEAYKILKKRCTLALDFRHILRDTNESMKLFRYVVEMKNNPLTNWRIKNPVIPTPFRTLYKEKVIPKLLDGLNWFLSGDNAQLHRVKRLELGGQIESRSDYDGRLKFLQALGPHLEELTWSEEWKLSTNMYMWDSISETCGYGAMWMWTDYQFREIQFPKLRVFNLAKNPTLDFHFDDGARNDALFNWFKHLVHAIKEVTAIRLDSPGPVPLTFLKHLYESGSMKLFPNLSELSLHHSNPDLIRILRKWNKPLRKMELNQLKGMKREDFDAFAALLSKHAQHLKSLQFIITPSFVRGGNLDRVPISLNFPAFPNLELLHIGWGPCTLSAPFVHTIYQQPRVEFIFPNGSTFVNYKTDLPRIKSLTLWPSKFGAYPDVHTSSYRNAVKAWEECLPFYKIFFPTIVHDHEGEREICRTLQRLSVPQEISTQRGTGPLFPKDVETAIAEMFPSVNDPWINYIREG